MAVTNFTPLLGLALPTTGDLSGTWGTTVNDAITDLLDDAVAGTVTVSADTNVTLTTTNGADNQARNAIVLCTGARTATRTITAPAQSKLYVIINATSGGFGVSFVGAGPTTGITVAAGDRALVAWNGSDFVRVGASAGGSNTQVQFNSSGNLAGSANLTFDGTTLAATQFNVTAQGDVRFEDTTGGQYVALQAPSTVATNITYTLPGTDGSNGQLLSTDGSGNLSFTTVSSPAVASGAIIINNTTIGVNYTIASGTNGFSVGPITISSGFAVTVSSGQRYVVI
jgi:hypothetical protein